MFFLKEDTAATIKLGPFVDKGDGVAYEVGMAAAMNHADTGVRISKGGGAFAARTTLTLPVYDAFGYYLVNLDITDTGTPGTLKVIFGDAAICLPCEANLHILHANVYDSLFGAAAADYLKVDTIQINDAAQTATLDTIKAETVLIVADTNELQVDDTPAALAAIDTKIDTAQTDLDLLTGADGATLATAQGLYAPNKVVPATKAEMDTAHALLATPAQVNTQVLDVLNTDTFAEPGQEAPTATTTLVDKIGYLYKFLRNKITNDGSTIKVYNDAGAVVDQKAGVSEAAGTVEREEFGSGP